MIITVKTLKNRIRKNGAENYRYIGRAHSNDGLSSYAIVEDLYKQETLHIDADDDVIASIVGACIY